ncbi:hypothetical protein P4S73_23315 [Paraglaciecola sp. Hal342]
MHQRSLGRHVSSIDLAFCPVCSDLATGIGRLAQPMLRFFTLGILAVGYFVTLFIKALVLTVFFVIAIKLTYQQLLALGIVNFAFSLTFALL